MYCQSSNKENSPTESQLSALDDTSDERQKFTVQLVTSFAVVCLLFVTSKISFTNKFNCSHVS